MTTGIHRDTDSPQNSEDPCSVEYFDDHQDSISGSVDISNFTKAKSFSAKQVIYSEGHGVDRIHVIRSGMVKLLSYLPNGRARIVRLHTRGHWFGLEGLVGQPYEHTAIAIGDVETYSISMSNLQILERDNDPLFAKILRQGYKHLAQADSWIAEFSTGGIKPRVARVIDFLSRLEYGESSNRVELLTVHEMAEMLGVTSESVSRILAEFKRNNTLHRLDMYPHECYEIDAQQLRREAVQ